jgi:hypothetical protein
MVRCISSITAAFGALLIANGVYGAPASGPVEKGFDLPISERNAKPKKKKAADEEVSEEAEDTGKKKKGKKGKKEEPPPEEEVEEEKPKKKGKKKGKKEEPPPEEEPVDVKDTESPTAEPEEDLDEAPEEEPAEEAPAGGDSEEEEGEKAEAAAAVSTDDLAGKLYIGARLGFGLFLGKSTGDEFALDYSSKFPIWLDLGYRITPSLMVGLYGQFAPATMKCPEGFFCSGASVIRFGVQAQYGFAPDATIAPWAGLGIGYEIASGTFTQSGVEGSLRVRGVEFMNLQVGADYMISKTVGIGPFLSFSLGRYSTGARDGELFPETPENPREGGIAKKEFHEWLVIGVRGAFSL